MINKEIKKQSTLASIIEFVGLLLLVFAIRTFIFGLYQVPTGSMETTILVGERFISDKLTYYIRNPQYNEIIAMNDPEYNYSDQFLPNLFQRYVWGPQNWTKRIIGIPGDTIRGAIENGKSVVYRNGKKLDEPYLNKYPLATEIVNGKLTPPRSYDINASGDQQPFYRIDENRIWRDAQGNPALITPEMCLYPKNGILLPDESRNNWNKSDVFFVKLGADEYWGMGDNRLGSKDCRFFGPIKGHQIHGRLIARLWSIDSNEDWWILDLLRHPIDYWKRVRWNRCYQWIT